MEVIGILMKKVSDRTGVSQRNGNPWRTAEFLLEIPGNYPRHIVFAVRDGQQDRIARFEALVGQTVKVSFDIDAHEYEGRWFNEVGAWGIMVYVAGGGQQGAQQPAQAQNAGQAADSAQAQNDAPQGEGNGEESKDLPF